jgi:hypothetical protein
MNGNQPSQIDGRVGSRLKRKKKADFQKMIAKLKADQEKRDAERKVN